MIHIQPNMDILYNFMIHIRELHAIQRHRFDSREYLISNLWYD